MVVIGVCNIYSQHTAHAWLDCGLDLLAVLVGYWSFNFCATRARICRSRTDYSFLACFSRLRMLGKQYAFVRFMDTSHVNMSQIMILPNLNAKNGA
jgi:hypothetical protein